MLTETKKRCAALQLVRNGGNNFKFDVIYLRLQWTTTHGLAVTLGKTNCIISSTIIGKMQKNRKGANTRSRVYRKKCPEKRLKNRQNLPSPSTTP